LCSHGYCHAQCGGSCTDQHKGPTRDIFKTPRQKTILRKYECYTWYACLPLQPFTPPKSTQSSPLLGTSATDIHTGIYRSFALFSTKKAWTTEAALSASHTDVSSLNAELHTTPANGARYVGQLALSTGWGEGETSFPYPHSHMAKTETDVTGENRGMSLDP